MSKTTVTTPALTAEEKAALATNQQLALKQLEVLNSQQAFTEDYQTSIKPIMDATFKMLQADIDAANDPAQKAIVARTAALQLQQLEDAGALSAKQKTLLDAQIKQIEQGFKATPEQIALIDETIGAQLAMGKSDLMDFSKTALTQLRDELAPSLGLRPSDTPILDRGGEITEQATRQYGQLERGLQASGAQAKLDYPLAAAGVTNQAAQFQQNLMMAQQQLAQNLSQQAASNRLSLAGMAGGQVQSGIGAGLGLANASAPQAWNWARGGTTKTSDPLGGFASVLGGIGGLATGLGSGGLGLSLSDERLKVDVRTLKHDDEGRRWVTFRYLGENTKIVRVGVIAQELFLTDPDAVVIDDGGYLAVDYGKLKEAS